MFSGQSLYRMVPISLAIGLFLPLPFYIAVSISDSAFCVGLTFRPAPHMAQCRLPVLQHQYHFPGTCAARNLHGVADSGVVHRRDIRWYHQLHQVSFLYADVSARY